jgi:hypothetical protein
MKLHKNVLNSETILLFRKELSNNLNKKCWAVSSLFWHDDLLRGIQGSCIASNLPELVENKIINDIKELVPPCNKLLIQCYVWGKNAGIAIHNDHSYKFGATIYMNDDWNINDGGIFLWKPNRKEEYKVIIPEFNNMVLNDNREFHMVTPVSPYITSPRVTIQIWGVD